MKPDSPSLRQRFREQARGELLDAAVAVFVRDGLKEARIDVIAAEAGVSVGTVYNLFGDRAGLVHAVMARGRSEVFEEVRAQLATNSDQPFEDRLSGTVRTLIGHMREHWALLRMFSEAQPPGCPHPNRAPDAIREVYEMLSPLLRDGIAEGVLAPTDLHVLTCALMGAIRTTIDVDLALGLDAPSADRADAIVRLFLEGARTRP